MKLSNNRDIDRVHVRDLDSVALVTQDAEKAMPPVLFSMPGCRRFGAANESMTKFKSPPFPLNRRPIINNLSPERHYPPFSERIIAPGMKIGQSLIPAALYSHQAGPCRKTVILPINLIFGRQRSRKGTQPENSNGIPISASRICYPKKVSNPKHGFTRRPFRAIAHVVLPRSQVPEISSLDTGFKKVYDLLRSAKQEFSLRRAGHFARLRELF